MDQLNIKQELWRRDVTQIYNQISQGVAELRNLDTPIYTYFVTSEPENPFIGFHHPVCGIAHLSGSLMDAITEIENNRNNFDALPLNSQLLIKLLKEQLTIL
jgi:hypothetical protein